MALTDEFINQGIGTATGSGTIGNPWGTIQHCLSTSSFDTTNGSVLRLKSGTPTAIAAALDFTTNFTSGGGPNDSVALKMTGYTNSADDGGIGEIDGNAAYSIINHSTLDFLTFENLEMYNCGTATYMIYLDRYINFYNCYLHNHNGSHAIRLGSLGNNLIGSTIRNVAGNGVLGGGVQAYRSLIEAGSNYSWGSGAYGMLLQNESNVSECIVRANGAGGGIYCTDGSLTRNTIWSNSGSGKGMRLETARISVRNNLVQGFSGAGGVGISREGGYNPYDDGNTVEDCATDFVTSGLILTGDKSNESASGSIFVDPTSFDYNPVDIDSVKDATYPTVIGHDF